MPRPTHREAAGFTLTDSEGLAHTLPDDRGCDAPSGTYLVWLRSGDREEGRILSLVP